MRNIAINHKVHKHLKNLDFLMTLLSHGINPRSQEDFLLRTPREVYASFRGSKFSLVTSRDGAPLPKGEESGVEIPVNEDHRILVLFLKSTRTTTIVVQKILGYYPSTTNGVLQDTEHYRTLYTSTGSKTLGEILDEVCEVYKKISLGESF